MRVRTENARNREMRLRKDAERAEGQSGTQQVGSACARACAGAEPANASHARTCNLRLRAGVRNWRMKTTLEGAVRAGGERGEA